MLNQRKQTKENIGKLEAFIAPIHHVVPAAHNVIYWRGEYYDLNKQLIKE
jgi:hypothetical protein